MQATTQYLIPSVIYFWSFISQIDLFENNTQMALPLVPCLIWNVEGVLLLHLLEIEAILSMLI